MIGERGSDTPSARLEPSTWERAHERLIADLRDLIRLRTVNPPGDEILAARHVGSVLDDAGVPATVVEPFPSRGSVVARLHGDGTGGGPLLLFGHLDVVPAPGEWTHDPFGADVADGYVYGRGAVDMKNLVAMELGVVLLLAAEARAAGRDPASDPVPGLRRDILFAATADEEAGGRHGVRWIADEHPEWLRADAAINEVGGVSMELGGRRFYPIGVAEKGFLIYELTVHGIAGHGSMPRDDNAAVRAARIVERLAAPRPSRLTPVTERLFRAIAEAAPVLRAAIAGVTRGDGGVTADEADDPCDASVARVAAAITRDTVSPNVIHAGVKYNVIPGEAVVEVTEESMRHELRRMIGEELWAVTDVRLVVAGDPVEAPVDHGLYRTMADTLRDHDPEAVPVPAIVPFGTDAKTTGPLGVPTYGFSPLRLDPAERFLERFHGVDERVSLEALRFGLPVLYDVVRRYCD
ncbi:MAG: M20/M25/M40 family metallo-hydrolase [Chloroflexi bacterium]|nr:MAG: M20/M25/M40 family metallo-hydrolase [Chloroflexota bacterium]